MSLMSEFLLKLGAVGPDTYIQAVYAALSVVLIGVFLRNSLVARRTRNKLRSMQALMAMQQEVADAHCMITSTNPQGQVLFANDRFLEATGFARDEVIGQPISSFYADANGEIRAELIRSHVREHGIWTGELEMRSKTGDVLWTHCTVKAVKNPDGEVRSIVALRTDITAAKRAQSDRQLRNIFDLLPDEVYLFSAETQNFTYMNQAALRGLGLTAAQMPLRRASTVRGFLSSPEFQALLRDMGGGDQSLNLTRQTVGDKVLEVSLQLIRTEDRAGLFFVMARDITAHVQTERAKAEFVATVSHELRTPLTSIKGALGLLSSGAMGPLSEAAGGILTMAQRNTERLILLINDLLDLEKISAGQMDMARSPCDLTSLVTDVVEMTTGYALQFGVTVEANLTREIAVVSANRDRLTQVLVNLVSNAIKFTPAGEKVVVGCSRQAPGTFRVSVADKGPGVPEELRPRIFERFSQARNAGSQGVAGTGLGLSISKAIIEHHDGKIGFHPGAECGTVFYFDLPLDRKAMAA